MAPNSDATGAAGALPALPDASSPKAPEPPSSRIELPLPELPQITPTTESGRMLPHVELPQTGVPAIDEVAGDLESALP